MVIMQKRGWVLSVLLCYSTLLVPANIAVDMNGVLVTQVGTIREIGLTRFLGPFNPAHIEDTLFDFLNTIVPRRPGFEMMMHKNRVMPQIMCDLQMGLITAAQVRTLVKNKLDALAPAFDSVRKVKLLYEIIDFIFTPERFVKVIAPLKQGVKILKKCYRQKDAQGNRLHKIFIITNWDESFALLYDNPRIKKFLDLCDGIVVSSSFGCMKPQKEIFERAFAYFGIDPENELTFYIDDEKANIDAARALNHRCLKCIHCHNFDFKTVDKTLRRVGIYSKSKNVTGK